MGWQREAPHFLTATVKQQGCGPVRPARKAYFCFPFTYSGTSVRNVGGLLSLSTE
jgi:hypothetical protein